MGAGLAGSALQAATITVTSAADGAPAVDGVITLREAMESANQDSPINADVPNVGFSPVGADTIQFDAAILPATISLGSQLEAQIAIGGDLTMQGPADRTQLVLDGQDATRHFFFYDKYQTGTVEISGLTLTEGNSESLYGTNEGGSIYAEFLADLTLTNVALTSNRSLYAGGAIFWNDGGNSALTVRDSLVDGNVATDPNSNAGGGAIWADGGSILIENSTVTNNDADDGGAILFDPDNPGELTIRTSTISDNSALAPRSGRGGAVWAYGPLTLIVEDSAFERNSALSAGGAIRIKGGESHLGAYAPGLTILRSTFEDNQTTDLYGEGGALAIDGSTIASIVNTTLSGNDGGYGGAVFHEVLYYDGSLYGSLEVLHSTIVGNTAAFAGGGVFLGEYGYPLLDHTIVANNTVQGSDEDLGQESGTFYVAHSLIEVDGGVAITDLGGNLPLNTDPDLATLFANGGPTKTHLPNSTSPVREAGDPAISGEPATDQRGTGFARVLGTIDIGSVEQPAGAVGAPGSFELSLAPNPVPEAGGPVVVTVSRVGGSDGAVSVDLQFTAGSATNPADYGATNVTVNFADTDATAQNFNVTIVNDTELEGDHDFTAALTNPQGGATLGATTSALVTIVDDPAGSVELALAPNPVTEGGGPVVATVSRVGGSEGSVSVDLAFTEGTATDPEDYGAANTTVSFPAGDATVQNFNVSIVDDSDVEGDHDFSAALSNAQGGVALGVVTSGVVTIQDNDFPPPGSFELSIAPTSVPEGGGPVVVTVSRVGGSAGAVSVDLQFVNGSATNPEDYGASNVTVNFPDGDAAPQAFNVTILDDPDAEGNETFSASLTNPQGGAALGAVASGQVTIVDDEAAVSVVEIPALDGAGKGLFAGLAAAAAALKLRRRRKQSSA